MITLGIIAVIITLAVGFGLKFWLDHSSFDYEIDNREYLIVSLVMCLIIIPATFFIGRHMAINNQTTYYENWGGWETKAEWVTIPCSKDGPCVHEYSCDPYLVPYECGYWTGTGEDRHYVSQTCYRTEWHDCPYTTEEWTFVVHSTIGSFTIASHNLPINPDQHRWRRHVRVPSDIRSGIPQFWQDAYDRLEAGKPGPVCAREAYANYILASQRSIMKRFNDSIGKYRDAGLLPDINSNIRDFYHLDRVYFAGTNPGGDWQGAVQRLNAAFGSTLEGDLHLVIVDSNKVKEPDNYAGALLAHWQSEEFGRDAFAKNGLLLILGTKDGATVDWARASTGMPLGNEHLLVQLQSDLKGKKLDLKTLIGNPKAELKDGEVVVSNGTGELEKILWGKNQFRRVSMTGDDEDDFGSGFKYLLREIEPTTGQKMIILSVVFLFSLIGWGIAIFVGVRTRSRKLWRDTLAQFSFRGIKK